MIYYLSPNSSEILYGLLILGSKFFSSIYTSFISKAAALFPHELKHLHSTFLNSSTIFYKFLSTPFPTTSCGFFNLQYLCSRYIFYLFPSFFEYILPFYLSLFPSLVEGIISCGLMPLASLTPHPDTPSSIIK